MAPLSVQLLGRDATTARALETVPAQIVDTGVAVVGEGYLDETTGADVGRRLAAGEVVIVLAQPESAAVHYAVPVALHAAGSRPLVPFTTGHGALPSLPRCRVLLAGDGTIEVGSVVSGIDGQGRFPDTPVVLARQRRSGEVVGTVVGSHQVGPGRLVFCQYQLCTAAAKGSGAERALLGDLIRWASVARLTLAVEESRLPDGRRVARYSHTPTVAQ